MFNSSKSDQFRISPVASPEIFHHTYATNSRHYLTLRLICAQRGTRCCKFTLKAREMASPTFQICNIFQGSMPPEPPCLSRLRRSLIRTSFAKLAHCKSRTGLDWTELIKPGLDIIIFGLSPGFPNPVQSRTAAMRPALSSLCCFSSYFSSSCFLWGRGTRCCDNCATGPVAWAACQSAGEAGSHLEQEKPGDSRSRCGHSESRPK